MQKSRSVLLIGLLSFFLIFPACGGGDNTSSGGGTVNSPHAGHYVGTGTITANASNGSESVSADAFGVLTLTIGDDGSVIMRDGSYTLKGTLNGSSFTVSANIHVNGCTGNIPVTAKGTVNGNTITGTFSGTGSCGISGTLITVTITGDFRLNKATAGLRSLGYGGGFDEAVNKATERF